jgi:hypothetical protein
MPDHTHDHAAEPEAPLNREQRRAARYRPKAGLPDPHAVNAPVADETPAPDEDTGRVADETSAVGDVQPAR